MADATEDPTIDQPDTNEPDPTDTGAADTTDWKAKYEEALKHSREWEKRAKANKNAARTLDDAQSAAKTAEERLAEATKRADDAETQLAAFKRDRELADLKSKVAKEAGVPADLLKGADEETLKASAEALNSWYKSRPRAPHVHNPAGTPTNNHNPADEATEAIRRALFGNQ